MAQKCPVVATNIGAIPDFIHEGKNGYLVNPKNPVELSEALIKLLDSPERSRIFGEYGNRLYWDHYTWDKTGSLMHDNIMQLLPSPVA